jgi:hypothetical protein
MRWVKFVDMREIEKYVNNFSHKTSKKEPHGIYMYRWDYSINNKLWEQVVAYFPISTI